MIKKTFVLSLFSLLFLTVGVEAQQENLLQYSQVRIELESENTIKTLQSLGIDLMCGAHHDHSNGVIELVLSSYELELLRSKNLRHEILVDDLSKQTEERLKKNIKKAKTELKEKKQKKKTNPGQVLGCGLPSFEVPDNFELGSMGGFTTYAELLAALDAMKEQYPELISTKASISETQSTVEGRPIYFVRISDNPEVDEDEPEVLYDGIHHAREPVSMMSLLYYMWYLLENYDTNAEIKNLVDNTEMYFVPMINPDGYLFNEETNPNGGGNWRKNRRNNGDGTFGVDINRNYGFNWGADDIGSSGNTYSSTYRGPAPFSEPETQMIRDFIIAHDFKVAMNNHVYSELLLHPWGTVDVIPEPDDAIFRAMGEHMTRLNRYYYGQTNFVIYDVNGDANDWAYGEQLEKDKIFGFTPEIGLQSEGGFWPDPDLIATQCEEQVHCFLSAAYFSMNYAILHDNSPLNVDIDNPKLSFVLEQLSAIDGEFTIQIEALSENILEIEHTELTSDWMEGNTFTELSTLFSLGEDIQAGDQIEFQITLNNGMYDIHTETIVKYYACVNSITEDGEVTGTDNWIGDWALTATEAYSGNFAFTEAEGINSAGEKIFEYAEPIDLTEVNFAYVEFFMNYDIQYQYDYVAFEVSTNGLTWSPLCGKYTKSGSDSFVTGHPPSGQTENAPLYEGKKEAWVREQIDLSEYLGESSLYLRFYSYTSNYYDNGQGFYFDDFKLLRNPLTHCEDGILNADETGVDCGGLDCMPCPSCDDGILNGQETSVDCGGPDCAKCPYDPCPAVNFEAYELLSYADQDEGYGDYFNEGNGLLLEDNAWKAIENSYTITPNTVVSFDFKSTEEGEIHEFLVDTDLILGGTIERFKLYGTQTTTGMVTDFAYSGSGEYESFVIPIGTYNTGTYNYFAFTADNDVDPLYGNSHFKNFRIYEDADNNMICDNAKADLTCRFTLLPNLSNGISEISHIVQIQEVMGLGTTDTITVLLPKDSRMAFEYFDDFTSIGPFELLNSDWEYDGANGAFHIWKHGKLLEGNSSSAFGFTANYDPQETSGISAFTVSILHGSGGEEYFVNNVDSETLSYFRE